MDEDRGWIPTDPVAGASRIGLAGHVVGAAYNLVRVAKLMEQAKESPVVHVA